MISWLLVHQKPADQDPQVQDTVHNIFFNLVPKPVHHLSVRVYVRMCVCVWLSIMFLVNASPPKPLDVATSNFADA